MPVTFKQIDYQKLNSRQQEAYNFQKVSAVLADFGFSTIRLTSDWKGADFIAQHHDNKTFLKVQLKGRLTFDKKYDDPDLYICFGDGDGDQYQWYMYNHAELLKTVLDAGHIGGTSTWKDNKPYHFPTLSTEMKKLLNPYRIPKLT
jgi:hypothetical protein